MHLNKTKWLTLAIALSFAILQVLQPFIHAHLDAEHPIQHTGFHVGDEHEESADFSGHFSNYTVSNIDHVSHTISVASGIKQDFNSTLLAKILSPVLLCVCFAIALRSILKLHPPLSLIAYSSLRRRLPAARAPPQL